MQEIRAHAGMALRRDVARVVARGCFDLNHVGAVVGENLCGVGAENDRGQVDDSYAGQWAAHRVEGVFFQLPWSAYRNIQSTVGRGLLIAAGAGGSEML